MHVWNTTTWAGSVYADIYCQGQVDIAISVLTTLRVPHDNVTEMRP